LTIACLRRFPGVTRAVGGDWITTHRAFGLRSVLGGVAVELNSRVDVLILGLFATDAEVGVYSFAAFFVEGLLQLTVISRRLLDPILTRMAEDPHRLSSLLRRGRNLSALAATLLGGVAVAAYPWYATFVGTRQLATDSWAVFAVLMLGASIFATYAAFAGIFAQTGRPALQSRLSLAVLVLNMVLNFALVPLWGLLGAAVATALAFIAGACYFRALVRRHLSIVF
jgi:O-antigen/teichoic acid export membrane protein